MNSYELICSDNVPALNQLEESSLDACITDPPYGMEIADVGWDHSVPPVETWQAVHRVLKPGAFVLSFCAPEFYHRMAVAVEDAGFVPRDMIIWMVTTKMAKANRLKPAHEPIFVAQKPLKGSIKKNQETWGTGKIQIDQARVPWDGEPPRGWVAGGASRRAFGGEVKRAAEDPDRKTQDADPRGRYPSNIVGHFDDPDHQKYFYAPRASRRERGEYNDHPTPKPISLMRYLCRIYSPLGGRVLDPFMGSGSTGIGALMEGRQFLGIDQSQHYVEISERRIQDHLSDPAEALFDYDGKS